MAPKVQDLFTRFSSYVDTEGDSTECWNWTGFVHSKGYGQLKIRGKMVYAHRFSYEAYYGQIPEKLLVIHSCNNRLCVNPKHLRVGTEQDNMQDCLRAGNHNWTLFTKKEVLGIRGIVKWTKLSYAEIAKMFGVHRETIENCVTRRTYAWID